MSVLKGIVKVPLVLLENVVFSLFPHLRPLVERAFYNPLDFGDRHREYSEKKFREFSDKIQSLTPLEGKTLLELGPGGSIGFGLIALENGIKNYVAIDDGQHAFIEKRKIQNYKNLLGNDPRRFERYFETGSEIRYRKEKIRFSSIDQRSRYSEPDGSIDIIYSCAVLEHVHNLELAFQEMARVIRKGGYMYHEVDLRDHIFSQRSLWFLSLPAFWFRLLFKNTGGYVNRARMSAYRQLAEKHGFRITSLEVTTRYTGRRPAFLRKLSGEDLETLSFIALFEKV